MHESQQPYPLMFDKNTYVTRRARLAKEVGDGVLLFLGN